MNNHQWILPRKVKGSSRINVTYFIEPELAVAFKEFSDTQTAKYGVKISVGTVLKTAMLQRYPEVRKRYEQLKQENSNDTTKHMDIKRSK